MILSPSPLDSKNHAAHHKTITNESILWIGFTFTPQAARSLFICDLANSTCARVENMIRISTRVSDDTVSNKVISTFATILTVNERKRRRELTGIGITCLPLPIVTS